MKKIAILSFVGLFCLYGCHSAPAPADLSTLPPTPAKSFIDEMKAKYNGDAGRLTSEERAKMDQITHGHTDVAMKPTSK